MRKLLFSLLLIALATLTLPAYAQQSSSTVEAALQAHFAGSSADAAASALRDEGFGYERLLVAEMLPSESTLMVEVELARGDTSLRYPLKLARKLVDDRIVWQVDWAPDESYARGLAAIASEEGFAALSAGDNPWTGIERLPAFPVIVADNAFVTPYGQVPAVSRTADPNAQMAVLKKLGEHAQQWVGLTLEDEPGTANVDLLVGKGSSWTRVTQALMAPASEGLFRTYLVGRSGGDVVALATAAPVVRSQDAKPLVVGMYREGEQKAVRVRIGEEMIVSTDICAEDVTFCAKSLDEFEQQALDHIVRAINNHDSKIAYVMFAATGEFSASEVAAHVHALSRALGVDSHKIFVGYIRGEQ